MGQEPPLSEPALGGPRGRWLALHLHYHEDQDLLLAELVVPWLREQVAAGGIQRFFYVRSALGGPHLRLRFRPAPEAEGAVLLEAIQEQARLLFEQHPSAQSWERERIERHNLAVLASDLAENDPAVYPDNSVRIAPFEPEVERYGGARLLSASLELFTLSSLAALEVLEGLGGSRLLRVPAFLRHLAGHAVALAGAAALEELLERLEAPARRHFPRALARADEVFDRRPSGFATLLHGTLAAPGGAAGTAAIVPLERGTAWLRAHLAAAEPRERFRIAASHLHMSANRLGLTNPEEAYVYRLLQRTVESIGLATSDAESDAVSDADLDAVELGPLVDAALARFAASTPTTPPRAGYS